LKNNKSYSSTTNTSKRKAEGIYATHEKESLLFMRAIVNGRLSAAYVKNGQLISYEPYDELMKQLNEGPCLEFTTP